MSQRTSTQRRAWKERALSLLLTAALAIGLVPGLTPPASAAHWADSYLDQLVDQGILRADQTTDPDASITRAEFMAIINRAYGYTETGSIPFTDVLPTDWFYDDMSIAYTAGYMAGTSGTTASPNDTLTREQAFCILGRNMMMKETPGESLAFADSRDISDWARGTIKTAVDNYVVSGYPDNTLHPQDAISKGQMAVLVTQCLGVPIQQSGTYELGGVFGNVTITAHNVTLRNTTISGDLYISGGVGLGGIKLENVDVLGRIIVSGTGESEGGDASVIMRNVTASEMLVDNMRSKTVTIRADGITDIARTLVRTNAYLEDNNTDGNGLMYIELDGDPGLRLTLAGRIKEVMDKTPGSHIQLAKGTLAKLTIDEAATNSTVQIDRNTKVSEINLDVATNVLGDGDIGRLNVNAPGSVVTMLPDNIYVRPGLNATIAGVVMDYQTAQEGSLDPRLLSGYPAANNIAPTGFRADFAGNKKGTVYWAVSYVSDGSIGENDLISPPSYGNRAIVNGNLAAPTGGDEVSAQVSNLVVGGSYYLSAVLVDEQKERSPVKVISFSTPDNTVPAFAQSYPYMSRTTRSVAQVTVMPTKSCKLYYALLPQGAQAPTANDLKAAAVTGNLGYGVRDVTKNTEDVFTVNSQRLEELKGYVLYLWLTDADGANSSTVRSLSFTIPDETPPEFTVDAHVSGSVAETSIPMAATLNEAGTIFWAVVAEGADYPLPNRQSDPLSKDNKMEGNTPVSSLLDSEFAWLCVSSGMGAISKGQINAAANTEITFNITGLQAETAYDLYYGARDAAGNHTVVKKLSGGIHTLDVNGPIISQRFEPLANGTDSPLSSSSIILDFNENICSNNAGERKSFVRLYNDSGLPNGSSSTTAAKLYIEALMDSIALYTRDKSGNPIPVPVWDGYSTGSEAERKGQDPENWVIRYDKVTVTQRADGHVWITFPGISSTSDPAVRLANGVTYYFQFSHLTDTSTEMNEVDENDNDAFNYNCEGASRHNIGPFTTVFSQVLMSNDYFSAPPVYRAGTAESSKDPNNAALVRQDMSFRLNPQTTGNTPDEYFYDLLFYADVTSRYDLYYRITARDGTVLEKGSGTTPSVNGGIPVSNNPDYPGYKEYEKNLIVDYSKNPNASAAEDLGWLPDSNGWRYLGSAGANANNGLSMDKDFAGCSSEYPRLVNLSDELYYEFVIVVTEKNGESDYGKWSNEIGFRVFVEAGGLGPIQRLSSTPTPGNRDDYEAAGLNGSAKVPGGGVVNIGLEPNLSTKYLSGLAVFTDTEPPKFATGYPRFFESEDATETIFDSDGTSLVGDTVARLQINLTSPGKVHYVVASKSGSYIVDTALNVTGTKRAGETTTTEARTVTGNDKVWDYVPTGDSASYPGNVIVVDEDDGSSFTVSAIDADPPIPNVIAEPTYSPDYYKFGEKKIGNGSEPIIVEGLQPSTDYFVYFVLEADAGEDATGNWSQVYVYKFKTAKTSGPKIVLEGEDNNGIVQATIPNTNRSILYYAIYTEADIKPGINPDPILAMFREPLSDHVKDIEAQGFELPPAYQGTEEEPYTILDALLDDYIDDTARSNLEDGTRYYFPPGGRNFNRYSVFDAYADNTIKSDVFLFIENGQRGRNPVRDEEDTKTKTVERNSRTPVNSNRKITDRDHVVLVMGCSETVEDKSDYENYTFKAQDGVRKVDNSIPQLNPGSCLAYLDYDPTTQRFSGTITLGFAGDNGPKEVYYSGRNGVQPIHQNCDGTDDDGVDGAVDFLSLINSSYLHYASDTEVHAPASSFDLAFDNVPRTATTIATILPTYGLTNESNGGTARQARLTLGRVGNTNEYRLALVWADDVNGPAIAEAYCSTDTGGSVLAPSLVRVEDIAQENIRYSDGTYDVTFTVVFDKNLYWAGSYVDPVSQLTTQNLTGMINFDRSNVGSVTATIGENLKIKFVVTGWKAGSSFTVFKNTSTNNIIVLSDSSGQGRRQSELTLTLTDRVVNSDTRTNRFVTVSAGMSSGVGGAIPEQRRSNEVLCIES